MPGACRAPGILGEGGRDVTTSGPDPAARHGDSTLAGGCLVTQQNTGAVSQLVPTRTPSPAQQPLWPPEGREGRLRGSRRRLCGAQLVRARFLHPLPSAARPETSGMGKMGELRHELFAGSCLLTACPKPCAQ